MAQIKIKPIKKVKINEILSARQCLVDNDSGVVIFWSDI
jgi:hypothetical protein